MPATIQEADLSAKEQGSAAASSFIGLSAYSEEQSAFFFGRTQEIDELSSLIKRSTLTLLFGKSGTGKTSLLNAGVFPKLKADFCLPIRVRLKFQKNDDDLITQIKNALKTKLHEDGFKVAADPQLEETLWEYFHREPLWAVVTPILVFDQFEEIFTLANKNVDFGKAKLDVLVEALSDVIENIVPKKLKEKYLRENKRFDFSHNQQNAKIIFSFREDFLPEFESFSAKIPSIKNSRFRLKAMDESQALEVIKGTWGEAIENDEAQKILSILKDSNENVSSASSLGTAVQIEPSLLNQVCSFIDEKRKEEHLTKISDTLVDKYPKGMILRTLYDDFVAKSNKLVHQANIADNEKKENEINEFIEENLVTEEGFRSSYVESKIKSSLIRGIDFLKSKYYLREEGATIELTHDVILKIVVADREKRRKKLAVAEAKRKAIKFIKIGLALAVVIWIVLTGSATVQYIILVKKSDTLRAILKRDSTNLANNNRRKKDQKLALPYQDDTSNSNHVTNVDSAGIPKTDISDSPTNDDKVYPTPSTIPNPSLSKTIGDNVRVPNPSGPGVSTNSVPSEQGPTSPNNQSSIEITDLLKKLKDQEKQLADKQKLLDEQKNRENENKRHLADNLKKKIEEKNKLEKELLDLKAKLAAHPEKPANVSSTSDEDGRIKKLQSDLNKSEVEYNILKTDYSSKIGLYTSKINSLQERIRNLESELGKFKPYIEPHPMPSSKEKTFGWGHDYATDKEGKKN